MRAIKFIINSNIFISLAAVCLSLSTQVQLGLTPRFYAFIAVIFFATLFYYNFHRFSIIRKNPETANDPKFAWAARHNKLLILIMGFSLAGILASVFFVRNEIFLLLGLLAILTLLYPSPASKNQYFLKPIAKLPGLKTLLLALVWTAVTVLIPVLQSRTIFDFMPVCFVFAERFAFIFAIAIPFDIRDRNADALSGIKTLAVAIGENQSVIVSLLCLFLSLTLAIIHYPAYNMLNIVPAYFISVAVAFVLLTSKKLRSKPLYYHGLLDGSILLHGLLIYLSFYLQT